jgi:hypothetical protein
MQANERGKGQIMLSEEWLRMLQQERKREIEAARRAHEARDSAPRQGGIRALISGLVAEPPAEKATPIRSGPQTPAATDLSA